MYCATVYKQICFVEQTRQTLDKKLSVLPPLQPSLCIICEIWTMHS